ncbi:hypothetical protein O9992_25025 [Vibrio lentus]|nr:hypothetical protein [Vibrio lentus]
MRSSSAIVLGMVLQGFSHNKVSKLCRRLQCRLFEAKGTAIDYGLIPDVSKLLNRGGLFSMMSTILLVFCAFSLQVF